MKHTDELLKDIFSEKLGGYESHVSPELWSNIASQLPQAAATASSSAAVAAKTISAKLIWTAAVAFVTVASVVTYLVVSNGDAPKQTITQKTEQQTQPSTEETTTLKEATSPTEETKGIAIENKNPDNKTTDSSSKSADKKASASSKSVVTNNSVTKSTPFIVAPSISKEQVKPNTSSSAPTNSTKNESTAQTQVAVETKEKLTAQFTVAPVNKEELRYFFMPQFAEAQSYFWDFGNGSTSTEMSPIHAFDEEGIVNVHLTITGKDGEKKELKQKLSVYEPGKLEVPNIFSPNGDGQNDYFDVLEKSKNVDVQKIIVFSMTDKVFESDGDRLWDGTDLQGNALPAGEYKYMILGVDKEGNKVDKKGFVTLRR